MKRFFQGAYFGVCSYILVGNILKHAKPEEYIGLAFLIMLGLFVGLIMEK